MSGPGNRLSMSATVASRVARSGSTDDWRDAHDASRPARYTGQMAARAATLPDGTTLRPLLARTNSHGAAFAGVHAAALTASGLWLWWALGTWWAVPAIVVYGIVLAHLFALLHEATH